jgi:hypothetical protein
MIERLGDVLYWAGCIIALVLAACAAFVWVKAGDGSAGFAVFVAIPAVVAWLIGRACRYVLSGR